MSETMLVLSRKVNEKILIGDDVIVTIVRVKGQGVRVGIEAPPEVRVRRYELHEADQQRQAAENAVQSEAAQEGESNAVPSDNPDAD